MEAFASAVGMNGTGWMDDFPTPAGVALQGLIDQTLHRYGLNEVLATLNMTYSRKVSVHTYHDCLRAAVCRTATKKKQGWPPLHTWHPLWVPLSTRGTPSGYPSTGGTPCGYPSTGDTPCEYPSTRDSGRTRGILG